MKMYFMGTSNFSFSTCGGRSSRWLMTWVAPIDFEKSCVSGREAVVTTTGNLSTFRAIWLATEPTPDMMMTISKKPNKASARDGGKGEERKRRKQTSRSIDNQQSSFLALFDLHSLNQRLVGRNPCQGHSSSLDETQVLGLPCNGPAVDKLELRVASMSDR